MSQRARRSHEPNSTSSFELECIFVEFAKMMRRQRVADLSAGATCTAHLCRARLSQFAPAMGGQCWGRRNRALSRPSEVEPAVLRLLRLATHQSADWSSARSLSYRSAYRPMPLITGCRLLVANQRESCCESRLGIRWHTIRASPRWNAHLYIL